MMMIRASTVAASSASLSRAILSSSSVQQQQQCIKLLQSASFTGSYSRSRWFSTSVRSKTLSGYSNASRKFLQSLTDGIATAYAAALLVEKDAYAKEIIKPDLLPKDVLLYQYEACPLSNKVKAFLDYYDVPYKVVEVNPLSKKEIKWSEYKKVPILMVDGEAFVDSSAIIDHMENKIVHVKASLEVSNDDEEKKWCR